MGGDCLKSLLSQLNDITKEQLLKGTCLTNVIDLVKRIQKDIHLQILNEIQLKCKSENFDVFFSREFDDKMDHGDIDVFYVDTSVDINVLINKLFDPLVLKRNGSVTTFSYKYSETDYFQIDFIRVTNIQLAQFFFSYGDVGMTMGMMAYHNKLKYGDNGLYLKLDGNKINELFDMTLFSASEEHVFELSKDPIQISNFFGLSYERWQIGFGCMEEAYDWLAQSTFYNPSHFIQNEGKLKRHEKPKRKFMSGFDQYSALHIDNYDSKEKIDIVNYAFDFFKIRDKVFENIRMSIAKRLMDNKRQEKFNGKMVVSRGISGKDVGTTISKFHEYIKEIYDAEFNHWLDLSSKEICQDTFNDFCLINNL